MIFYMCAHVLVMFFFSRLQASKEKILYSVYGQTQPNKVLYNANISQPQHIIHFSCLQLSA